MFVVCCGMFRAGSTWQYQIASHLAENKQLGERIGYFEGENLKSLPSEKTDRLQIFKCHNQHPYLRELLDQNRAKAIYSFRDIRDVIYSMMHKTGCTFEKLVIDDQFINTTLLNDSFWRAAPNVLIQPYREITLHPEKCVKEMADFLGANLTMEEATAIARQYSQDANREKCRTFSDQLIQEGVNLEEIENFLKFDTHSLLHWNHLRSGKKTGWKDLTKPEHVRIMLPILSKWLIDHGFEKSDEWSYEYLPPSFLKRWSDRAKRLLAG